MDTKQNIQLTSAELSQIWSAYMNDSMSVCTLQHFLAKVEDKEIKPLIEFALQIAQTHVEKLTDIFHGEDYPVPTGFEENEDVDIDAPRLFSDIYVLNYVAQLGKLGLNAYSMGISLAVRSDVFQYFSECFQESTQLLNQANQVLLSKGLYDRSPYLPTPARVDFIKSKKFLQGYFGERRPLTALEITNLYANIQRNALGKATMIGFSQVAKSKTVGKYLVKGKEISAKHVEIFGSMMSEEDLTVPMTWDTEVTDSQIAPFSDKLMMFHTTALVAMGIAYYGMGVSTSPRRDIGVTYSRLTAEIIKYSEDGANIMIDHGWLEQPPQSFDREELSHT